MSEKRPAGRPTGRPQGKVDGSAEVHKRGEGLNTGKVGNVQFGLYLLWALEICVALSLVREDRDGPTSGVPVVPPGAPPGSRVGYG